MNSEMMVLHSVYVVSPLKEVEQKTEDYLGSVHETS